MADALAQSYFEFLADEGFRPKLDADGDVTFKVEGGHYYIKVDTDDPTYFQLVFPNFWQIDSEDERQHALECANRACDRTKVAKVYLVGDGSNVSASVELFLPRPGEFRPLFARCLRALRAGVKNFVQAMQDEDPDDYGRGFGGSGYVD